MCWSEQVTRAWWTYSLLGELTGTLVLAVTQQLNDTALVGGKAVVETLASV